MVISTENCSKHGHPEFVLYCDESIIEVDRKWLVDYLERAVAGGEIFRDGETFQIGWMWNRIQLVQDGFLTLQEPEMTLMPIEWVTSVTQTLIHLRLQKDFCGSLFTSADLCFPSILQSCVICTNLGQTEDFMMDRSEPEGNHSGWFIGCAADSHDHNDVAELKRVSLYEAAVVYEKRIIPYLALPVGVLLTAGIGRPVVFLGEEQLEFKKGSLLYEKYRRK